MVAYRVKHDKSYRLSRRQVEALIEVRKSPCGYVGFLMVAGKRQTASSLIKLGLCEEHPVGALSLTGAGKAVASRLTIKGNDVVVLPKKAPGGAKEASCAAVDTSQEFDPVGECDGCGVEVAFGEDRCEVCGEGEKVCGDCDEKLPCSCVDPVTEFPDGLRMRMFKNKGFLVHDCGDNGVAFMAGMEFAFKLSRGTARVFVDELLGGEFEEGTPEHKAEVPKSVPPAPVPPKNRGYRRRTKKSPGCADVGFDLERSEEAAKWLSESANHDLTPDAIADRLGVEKRQGWSTLHQLRSRGIVERVGMRWVYVSQGDRPVDAPVSNMSPSEWSEWLDSGRLRRVNGRDLWEAVKGGKRVSAVVRVGRERRMPQPKNNPILNGVVRSVTKDHLRCKITGQNKNGVQGIGWVQICDMEFAISQ